MGEIEGKRASMFQDYQEALRVEVDALSRKKLSWEALKCLAFAKVEEEIKINYLTIF